MINRNPAYRLAQAGPALKVAAFFDCFTESGLIA
jgi:hypothetical protein